MVRSTKFFQQCTKEGQITCKVNRSINNCLKKLLYHGQIHFCFSEFLFLYVVLNHGNLCCLLDWCTLFVQHIYCFSSGRQFDNYPFIRRSNRVTCEKAFGETCTQPKNFQAAQSYKLLTSGFIAKTAEKPGVCIKLKSRSKIYST